MEKIVDYAVRPYLRDYVFTKFLNGSDYGLADLIEVEPTSISAGDEGLIEVVEWFQRNEDNSLTMTRRQIMPIHEVVEVRHDEVPPSGIRSGSLVHKDSVHGFAWTPDIHALKNEITNFANAKFFKPVYWMPVTLESLRANKDKFANMGGHLLLRVMSERNDRITMQQMSVQDAGYGFVESCLEDKEEVYIMSVPASELQKMDTSQGFGDGIPPMPGISGNVTVKKPSDGDGGSGDGGSGIGDTYSSTGSNWWGSDSERGV